MICFKKVKGYLLTVSKIIDTENEQFESLTCILHNN